MRNHPMGLWFHRYHRLAFSSRCWRLRWIPLASLFLSPVNAQRAVQTETVVVEFEATGFGDFTTEIPLTRPISLDGVWHVSLDSIIMTIERDDSAGGSDRMAISAGLLSEDVELVAFTRNTIFSSGTGFSWVARL